jgi:hypothetical protein
MTYLFVDPGESTGWCKFDDSGKVISIGTTRSFAELCNWISVELTPETAKELQRCVVEEFMLFPWKSQAQLWSEFETVQVIGAIRAQCNLLRIPWEKAPSRNKNMGFMYMGTTEPPHSNPANHQIVAMAHGVFWLQRAGIRTPQQDRQK